MNTAVSVSSKAMIKDLKLRKVHRMSFLQKDCSILCFSIRCSMIADFATVIPSTFSCIMITPARTTDGFACSEKDVCSPGTRVHPFTTPEVAVSGC